MAHTPGPWTIAWEDDDGEPFDNGVRIDAQEGPVAFNVIDCSAILIAAAPELLAALRAATDFIAGHNECMDRTSPHGGDREWYAHCDSVFSDCKAAIAKAEGRTDD